MSWIETYRGLARYNRWMNERLYAFAGELGDQERKRDVKAFFGSLQGTLNHILVADLIWLRRFTKDPAIWQAIGEDGKPIGFENLRQPLFERFEPMRAQRAKTDRDIESWVATLDDGKLAAPFAYSSMAGEPFEHPLWWALQHFFNHQTHHRGQATTILMQLGRDPGVTDLVYFLRSEVG